MAKDLNKNISEIEYNCLNLPGKVTFTDGSTITYTYAADGTKLQTVRTIGGTTTTTDYCGNAVYENGTLKYLLTEEGYITVPDKKYHYYLRDHQGNNRVVVDQAGNVEEVSHYYLFGGMFASTDVQPYKYNGKEWDKTSKWYDYGARNYDAAVGRFTTNDRFAEKYVALSPYQYGANKPTQNIDINGDSIAILNKTGDAHMAMLIQNDQNKWQYYSINGDNVYFSGLFTGGRKFDDLGEHEFNSPQEFMNSPYNTEGDGEDLSINSYGFPEGYILPTTKEQDDIIRKTFTDISRNEDYRIIGNNCTTSAQRALEAAGIETYNDYWIRIKNPLGNIYRDRPYIWGIKRWRPQLPSISYESIIRKNPQGTRIYKQ